MSTHTHASIYTHTCILQREREKDSRCIVVEHRELCPHRKPDGAGRGIPGCVSSLPYHPHMTEEQLTVQSDHLASAIPASQNRDHLVHCWGI